MYTIAAVNFQRRLARDSTGKLAIVTGFAIWAVCLLMHPWIVRYRAYADIASHIWNMQKSLISIGMILVMLEEQVSSNEWLALHDELTGLPNRRLFADRLTTAIERADRTSSRLALLILGLNGFKTSQRHDGPAGRGQVLREVSSHLRKSVRASDTLARLGGDEFIIVAANRRGQAAHGRSWRRFAGRWKGQLMIDGQSMIISASMGIALYPDDADDSISLLRIGATYVCAETEGPSSCLRQAQI